MTAAWRHAESSVDVQASPAVLFQHLDDPRRLSSHMEERSWAMAGSGMQTEVDAGGGRAVGSRIRMHGRMMGIRLELQEAITEREPPWRKAWRTLGDPRLVVIGHYRMRFTIEPWTCGSRLTVAIDYAPVRSPLLRPLGRWYANWCTRRMAQDAAAHFRGNSPASGESDPRRPPHSKDLP